MKGNLWNDVPLGEKYESKSPFPEEIYFGPSLKHLIFLELGTGMFKCLKFPFLFFL